MSTCSLLLFFLIVHTLYNHSHSALAYVIMQTLRKSYDTNILWPINFNEYVNRAASNKSHSILKPGHLHLTFNEALKEFTQQHAMIVCVPHTMYSPRFRASQQACRIGFSLGKQNNIRWQQDCHEYYF